MKEDENIRNELNAISPVWKGMPLHTPFQIPDGYFHALSSRIMQSIEKHDFIIQPGLHAARELPSGYFDAFPERILQKIKQNKEQDVFSPLAEDIIDNELANIAPSLHALPKKNVFDVPEGYFATKEWNLPVQKQKPAAKIIALPAWAQYLVAASVFAIISIGAVLYVSSRQAAPTAETLFSKSMDNLSDSAISNYLNTEPVYTIGVSAPINQSLDIQSMIYNMSNQQIEQYLDETKDLILPSGQNI